MADDMAQCKRPHVGVGVFVMSDSHPGCILLGKRKHRINQGDGLYALPGGHLEFGEEWEDCARREIMEETGLHLKDVCYCITVNGVNLSMDYHYITIFMAGFVDEKNGISEPENMEPDKCHGWQWIKWTDFPQPEELFWPLSKCLELGYNPFQMLNRTNH